MSAPDVIARPIGRGNLMIITLQALACLERSPEVETSLQAQPTTNSQTHKFTNSQIHHSLITIHEKRFKRKLRRKNRPSPIQKGAELNLSTCGTGIPWNDKRAHARVVSNLLIISFLLNYQFSS